MLVFSDTNNKQGVLQVMESNLFGDEYGAITDNADRLLTATRYANQALDDYVSIALRSDTRWQFDDSTITDYPQGTLTLITDQSDYPILVPLNNGQSGQPTTTPLKIERVEVLDANGVYHDLTPVDEADYRQPFSAQFPNSGAPSVYDKNASAVHIYPAPSSADVTLVAGLRVTYQRVGNYFDSTDLLRKIGILSTHHDYIPLRASYLWARSKNLTIREVLARDLSVVEKGIEIDFSKRDKDDRPRLVPRVTSSR